MHVLKLPKVGQGMEEGTVVEWRVSEGDRVASGDVIVLFESDKATNEIAADEDGVLLERYVSEGETVPIGTELGRVGSPDEAAADSDAGQTGGDGTKSGTPGDADSESPDVEPPATVHATPAARRLAREHGLDIEEVAASRGTQHVRPEDVSAAADELRDGDIETGTTGRGNDSSGIDEEILGSPRARVLAAEHDISVETVAQALNETRIREADVEAYVKSRAEAAADAAEPTPVPSSRPTREPPEGQTHSIDEEIGPMFDRMDEAARNYASTTTIQRADVTGLLDLYERLEAAWNDPVPMTAFVVRAVADYLPDYPMLNAAVEDEDIVRIFQDVNVGVAVDAGERGLLVPTVYGADGLTVREIGREIARLADGASEGTLDTTDLRNGTFTISNAGGLGAYINTPMINPPQTAVLGVCKVVEEPTIVEGEIVPRKLLHLCLTYDHRVVEGADAVGFLTDVRERLETPETLLS